MSTSIFSAAHTPRQNQPTADEYVDPNSLRTTFALAMSAMYSAEVPLYSDLIRIVQDVNSQVLQAAAAAQTAPSSSSPVAEGNGPNDTLHRITLERHGAIRLGTPTELHTARRIFALMGMQPVNYYDLSVAGLPMHATCFRPVTPRALAQNPFRIFTTLLRPSLLPSPAARSLAERLLSKRAIFSPALLDLVAAAEHAGGRLTKTQGDVLVAEALRSFSWQPVALATAEEYGMLSAAHPILADIACFRAAHINHLTPRALDIDAAQRRMVAEGMRVKTRIEGPPRRRCGVLLRQTSFLAVEEGIRFPTSGEGEDDGDRLVEGCHKARFGEIEERGAAVTALGRRLYDELLAASRIEAEGDAEVEESRFAEGSARAFPDNWDGLRREGLIYCEYQCTEGAKAKLTSLKLDVSSATSSSLLDQLVGHGVLRARPITYEDFLPFSAAGIFQSNLQSADSAAVSPVAVGGDREGYERALQCAVLDSDQLYAEAQRRSLETCAVELGWGADAVAGLI